MSAISQLYISIYWDIEIVTVCVQTACVGHHLLIKDVCVETFYLTACLQSRRSPRNYVYRLEISFAIYRVF